MIQNKKELKEYYRQDLRQSELLNKPLYYRLLDRRYKFYKTLRRTEYYCNCKRGPINGLIKRILIIKYNRMCNKYNWSIPINVFGPGLTIVHVGTIVVSGKAKIGKNCRIHVCTNIGNAPSHGKDGTPTIGDNVYIGPGAKIFGPITIGDNVVIGANAVVNKSFPSDCTIAGVPAKVISKNTSNGYINQK